MYEKNYSTHLYVSMINEGSYKQAEQISKNIAAVVSIPIWFNYKPSLSETKIAVYQHIIQQYYIKKRRKSRRTLIL